MFAVAMLQYICFDSEKL